MSIKLYAKNSLALIFLWTQTSVYAFIHVVYCTVTCRNNVVANKFASQSRIDYLLEEMTL